MVEVDCDIEMEAIRLVVHISLEYSDMIVNLFILIESINEGWRSCAVACGAKSDDSTCLVFVGVVSSRVISKEKWVSIAKAHAKDVYQTGDVLGHATI